MLICEKFIILMLDDEKGKKHSSTSISRDVGISGAMIMDLILMNRIRIQDEHVYIRDTTTTGEPLLDQVSAEIDMSPKARKVRSWLERIGKQHKYYIKQFLYKFEKEGIVKREDKTILKIFHSVRYHFIDPEIRNEMLMNIQNAIIENQEPLIDILCIMNLLKETELYRDYISKEYRDLAKDRLLVLNDSKYVESDVSEMIEVISKAIRNIIDARRAAATSAATTFH